MAVVIGASMAQPSVLPYLPAEEVRWGIPGITTKDYEEEHMKDFAVIRKVKGRQILFYTESDYDGTDYDFNTLHVLTRTSNGINVNIKLEDEDNKQKLWNMFEIFKTEEELESLPFIQALIESLESIEKEGIEEEGRQVHE
jgi:hypothetical protein